MTVSPNIVETSQTFLALLTLTVNAGTILLAGLMIIARFDSNSRRGTMAARWLTVTRPALLLTAFLITSTAVLGSLWFSEIVGYTPCKLCWYQRIMIFPLPLVLGSILLSARSSGEPVDAARKLAAARHLLPVNVVGILIALWHVTIERNPNLSAGASCSLDAPCTVPWFTEYGLVTLSWMSLTVSVASMLLILAGTPKHTRAGGR